MIINKKNILAKLSELKQNISIAEKNKEKCINYLQKLTKSCNKEKFPSSEYKDLIYASSGGYSIEKKIKEYENYIFVCKKHINYFENLLSREKRRTTIEFLLFAISLSFIFLIISLMGNFNFTGFSIENATEDNLNNFVDDINSSINNNPQEIFNVTESVNAFFNEINKNQSTDTYSEEGISNEFIEEKNITEYPFVEESPIEINNSFEEPMNFTEVKNFSSQIVSSENLTENSLNMEIIQSDAVLGKPVKWKKIFVSQDIGELSFSLPKDSKNIIANKIKSNQELEKIQFASISQTGEYNLQVTGTGQKYQIEYETPAPYSIEEKIENGKRVQVIGSDEIHYKNILSFTNIDEEFNITNPNMVKIYWLEDNSFISINKIADINNNGIYDYIEWIVPYLSNQTFDIYYISEQIGLFTEILHPDSAATKNRFSFVGGNANTSLDTNDEDISYGYGGKSVLLSVGLDNPQLCDGGIGSITIFAFARHDNSGSCINPSISLGYNSIIGNFQVITTNYSYYEQNFYPLNWNCSDLDNLVSTLTTSCGNGKATSWRVSEFGAIINYSSINSAPDITFVSQIPEQSVLEGGMRIVNFSVNVFDRNGAENINSSSLSIKFSNGQIIRKGICNIINTDNSSVNYNCSTGIWYWDNPGIWNVSIAVFDILGKTANYSSNFLLQESTCMAFSPNSINWDIVYPGDRNKLATNNPIIINNTCNANIGLDGIKVTSFNLNGIDSLFILNSSNFIVNERESCTAGGVHMEDSLKIPIPRTILSAGNNSINDGSTGQERLYFCLKDVPDVLPQQGYSSIHPWEISLLAVAFIVRNPKNRIQRLRWFKKLKIPISIFIENKELGAVEVLCRYLKDKRGARLIELSALLNRDNRSIGTSYRDSLKKMKSSLIVKRSMMLPLKIFSNRRFSLMESVVKYLRNNLGMRNSEIAKLLKRDARNIYTLYSRAVNTDGNSLKMFEK